MPQYKSNKIVRHTPEQMFALVADVEHYPEFLPLCERLIVRGRKTTDDGEILIASMTVAYKLIRETFVSKVTLQEDRNTILVEYLDGPFEHLENRWTFTEAGEGKCDIGFHIDYTFKNRALGALMGTMFDRAFRKFSDAFETRANELYGRG